MDVPLRLSITPSDIGKHFRVQIYLNGWQLGKYVNNLGYAILALYIILLLIAS